VEVNVSGGAIEITGTIQRRIGGSVTTVETGKFWGGAGGGVVGPYFNVTGEAKETFLQGP